MKTLGFGQFLILLFLCFLLFGDFVRLKKKVIDISKSFLKFLPDSFRKKRS